MKAKAVVRYGLMGALMLVLGYLESLIPLFASVPGIKLGLSNAVLLFALYTLGAKAAILLGVVKVLLSGLLFGSPAAMLYSGAGAALSLLAMILLVRARYGSPVGVSIAGAAMHNIGQCAVAAAVIGVPAALAFFPLLLGAAVFTGALTGTIANLIIKRLDDREE